MLKLFIEFLHYARVKLKLNRKSKLLRIIKKQNPKSILEIGVHDGENALRLISAISKKDNLPTIRYVGVDLFSLMTSAEMARQLVSQIPKSKQDVEFLITSNFPNIDFELFEGNSNEILKIIKEKFEIIFIDGGHSYETVKKDLELSESLLSDGGLIILDDYTNRNAEVKVGFGITRLVSELDKNKWDIQISKLPDLFLHDWGLLITRLVILRKIK